MFSKLFDNGVIAIPLNQKKPFFNDWQRYADEPPTPLQIELWDEKYRNHNIGVLLGTPIDEEYVLGAIDIDVDNKETLDNVPPSPVRKKGKKGETRFYKLPKNFKTSRFFKSQKIEILQKGHQTVIPPSLHPETLKPYVWLTPDTLCEFDLKDLPVLNSDFVTSVPSVDEKHQTTAEPVSLSGVFHSPDGIRCPHDSYARMNAITHALIAQSMPTDDAVHELLKRDKELHDIHFFSDKTRPDMQDDEFTNATRWLVSFRASVNRRRKSQGLEPELPQVQQSIDVSALVAPVVHKLEKLPELPGAMREMKEIVLRNAFKPNDTYACAAVISLFSVLCSTKYSFNNARPNTFSLLLADSGQGKDVVRRFLTSVLQSEELRRYNLMGLQSYVSAPALIADLSTQRTRLDVVDEFSSFIKNAANPNQNYKRDLMTELNTLYSVGDGFYGGIKAISRENTGSCYGPSISLMAMVQPETFIESANKDMIDNGFFSRFLYFYSDERNELSKEAFMGKSTGWDKAIAIVKHLFSDLQTIDLNADKSIDIGAIRPKITAMQAKQVIYDHLYELSKDLDSKSKSNKLYSRAGENMNKLSILFAASNGRNYITLDDLDLAYSFVDTLIQNSMSLVSEATAGNARSKVYEKFINFLKKEKGRLSSKQVSDFFRTNRDMQKTVISDLKASGTIILEQKNQRIMYVYTGE